MRTLDAIWKIYLDRDLNPQELKDLIWHIENDEDPQDAISITADMGLKSLGHVLAKHLNHNKPFIRQLTIGCLLGQLELPEYAEKGLEMAQNDDDHVRNIAIFDIGGVINKAPFPLTKKIAAYLLESFKYDECEVIRGSAYHAILTAMEIPRDKRPPASRVVKELDINQSIVSDFCKKYNISTVEKKKIHHQKEGNDWKSQAVHPSSIH